MANSGHEEDGHGCLGVTTLWEPSACSKIESSSQEDCAGVWQCLGLHEKNWEPFVLILATVQFSYSLNVQGFKFPVFSADGSSGERMLSVCVSLAWQNSTLPCQFMKWGQKKHINIFNMHFLFSPPKNAQCRPPEIRSLCASDPGKECKKGPTQTFSGWSWGQERPSQTGHFGPQEVLFIALSFP